MSSPYETAHAACERKFFPAEGVLIQLHLDPDELRICINALTHALECGLYEEDADAPELGPLRDRLSDIELNLTPQAQSVQKEKP